MATRYVDYIEGNDANDGSNWLKAKQHLKGFTAVQLTHGDEVHVAESSPFIDTGMDGTFTGVEDGVFDCGTKSISGYTIGANSTITCNGHNFTDGMFVRITYVSSNPAICGIWKVANCTPNTFDIVGGRSTLASSSASGYVSDATPQIIKCPVVIGASPIKMAAALWTPGTGVTIGSTYDSSKFGSMISMSGTTLGPKKLYYATLPNTVDLSAFQIVNFVYRQAGTALGNNVLAIKLCSDALGDVPLATINVPGSDTFVSSYAYNEMKKVVDFGGALPSGINSIALYNISTASVPSYFYFHSLFFTKPQSDPTGLDANTFVFDSDKKIALGIQEVREDFIVMDTHFSLPSGSGMKAYGASESKVSRLFKATAITVDTTTTTCDELPSQLTLTDNLVGTTKIRYGFNKETDLQTGVSIFCTTQRSNACYLYFRQAFYKYANIEIEKLYFTGPGYGLQGNAPNNGADVYLKECCFTNCGFGIYPYTSDGSWALKDCIFCFSNNPLTVYSSKTQHTLFKGTNIFLSCYNSLAMTYGTGIIGETIKIIGGFYGFSIGYSNSVSLGRISRIQIKEYQARLVSQNSWVMYHSGREIAIDKLVIFKCGGTTIESALVLIKDLEYTNDSSGIYNNLTLKSGIHIIKKLKHFFNANRESNHLLQMSGDATNLMIESYERDDNRLGINAYSPAEYVYVMKNNPQYFYTANVRSSGQLSADLNGTTTHHAESAYSWAIAPKKLQVPISRLPVGIFYCKAGIPKEFFIYARSPSAFNITLSVRNAIFYCGQPMESTTALPASTWTKCSLTVTTLNDERITVELEHDGNSLGLLYIDSIMDNPTKEPSDFALWSEEDYNGSGGGTVDLPETSYSWIG